MIAGPIALVIDDILPLPLPYELYGFEADGKLGADGFEYEGLPSIVLNNDVQVFKLFD